MPFMNKQDIEQILSTIIDPHTQQDLIRSQVVKKIEINDRHVQLEIEFGYPANSWFPQLKSEIESKLSENSMTADIEIISSIHSHTVQHGVSLLKGVKNIIAVASGKGGVGKSTVSVNFALALQAEGARVGILDADIYGPSQPKMLGVNGKPQMQDGKLVAPEAHGISVMSIGFLVDEEAPMIWRGPMVTQALQQLLNETIWPDLDYLIIDLPPGTGDTQLTLAQKVPVAGAIVVTTPQDIALLDARKAYKMFEKVSIPVLGVVENMSTHVCSQCGYEEAIFGQGGGAEMAQQYEVPLLGQMPLSMQIRQAVDQGAPTVVSQPESPLTVRYLEISRKAAAQLAMRKKDYSAHFPTIEIQQN